jgi:hypothetical protein
MREGIATGLRRRDVERAVWSMLYLDSVGLIEYVI